MNNILEHDGRKFVIGSYAVSKALNHIGFSLSNIAEAIDTRFFDLINAVIYYSAEYPLLREGKPSDFTELDVFDLLDKTGGYNGTFIQNFTKVMMQTINPGSDESKPATDTSKKKNSTSKKTA